jgi:hypothetical protein
MSLPVHRLNETKCFYTWYPHVSLSFTLNAFINPQAFSRSHTHRRNIKSCSRAQVSVRKREEEKKKKKKKRKEREKRKKEEKEERKERKKKEK